MIIRRTPKVIHTTQLIMLCQCFGRTIPMVYIINLIVEGIFTIFRYIGLCQNTIIPSATCGIAVYSCRKLYP